MSKAGVLASFDVDFVGAIIDCLEVLGRRLVEDLQLTARVEHEERPSHSADGAAP